MKYESKLTREQLKALPDTYGHPVNCPHVLRHEETRQMQESTYTLEYADITDELATALDIGLVNYGSGRAAWDIPRILKGAGNMNKLTQLWQLYCSEVAGQYDKPAINRAWKGYTRDQQETIQLQLAVYLDDCADYLRESF